VPIPGVTFAEWLRSPALWQFAGDVAIAAAWGEDAPQSERITALANSTDAAAEAVRQMAFQGIPMAKEEHRIKGRLAPYIGKVVTITTARLGYAAGLEVLVLGAQDDLATGMSAVTVLRKLT
jgi:hypothetical protein